MVVVGSPATTIFITNCNKLITIIRIEATRPMCFKNRNLQADSKVKTCKDCIDEKTLNSISCWIVSFYLFLVAIPVSAVFIFNAFYKINICGKIPVGCLISRDLFIAFIIFFVVFYFKTKNIKCKEIYDDLKVNSNVMAWSAVCVVACLLISAFISSDYVTKITVYLALLLVTCFIGFRAKYYNKKYALTKINMDYTNTMNNYSKTREYETEIEFLTKMTSYLKYYKEMETNYLMMSAFFVFVTSVLGKFY
ncbi:permease [Gardnerella sp. DNF01144]|uniref:permease n=1 Tax=Gardnerella sp. DNF01144 TaxID=2749058 RepID=UPI003BA9A539